MNDADESLVKELLRFARDEAGPGLGPRAREEFDLAGAGEKDSGATDLPCFIPWMIYCWRVPEDLWTDPRRPGTSSIAERFLARRGSRLETFERRFLEVSSREPYSFWEALSAEPGSGLEVEDALRGTRVRVSERSASGMVDAGMLLWARVISLDGLAVFSGMGSIPLEPQDKLPVIDLASDLRRRHRQLTTEVLREEEQEVRDSYLSIRHRRLHPAPPILRNTDGEDLSFHSLRFRVDDPHEAFEALAPLDIVRSVEELRAEAKAGADGRIVHARLDWSTKGNAQHPGWDNTILGHFTIDGTSLVAEVNSEARAMKVRKEIEKRLRKRVTHLETTLTSVE